MSTIDHRQCRQQRGKHRGKCKQFQKLNYFHFVEEYKFFQFLTWRLKHLMLPLRVATVNILLRPFRHSPTLLRQHLTSLVFSPVTAAPQQCWRHENFSLSFPPFSCCFHLSPYAHTLTERSLSPRDPRLLSHLPTLPAIQSNRIWINETWKVCKPSLTLKWIWIYFAKSFALKLIKILKKALILEGLI